MENAEDVMQRLDEFSKHKPKTIPKELDDYLCYVARTGDPVYQWPLIKSLFKEKLLSVITDFYETSPGIDIPYCPNVDTFNYDVMKNNLAERIDGFASAPFTVQRICELLTTPRKNYNRIDKFMRAVEKNILVVSTREPGPLRHAETEGDHMDSIVNGSENSEYNVDVEMEDISNWKENAYQAAPSAGSSDMSMSVENPAREKSDKIEADIADKEATETPDDAKKSDSETHQVELHPAEFITENTADIKSPIEIETDPLAIDEVKQAEPTNEIVEDATKITEDVTIKIVETPPEASDSERTDESVKPEIAHSENTETVAEAKDETEKPAEIEMTDVPLADKIESISDVIDSSSSNVETETDTEKTEKTEDPILPEKEEVQETAEPKPEITPETEPEQAKTSDTPVETVATLPETPEEPSE